MLLIYNVVGVVYYNECVFAVCGARFESRLRWGIYQNDLVILGSLHLQICCLHLDDVKVCRDRKIVTFKRMNVICTSTVPYNKWCLFVCAGALCVRCAHGGTH